MHSLRSGDIDILRWIDSANLIQNKLTVTSRELFLKKSNEAIANDVKLINIDFIDKMMPYLNQFLIEPNNIPVVRAFVIFKYNEKLLVILRFGLISATSKIAKFNYLPNELEKYNPDIIMPNEFLMAKTSDSDYKLKKCLHLYYYLIT